MISAPFAPLFQHVDFQVQALEAHCLDRSLQTGSALSCSPSPKLLILYSVAAADNVVGACVAAVVVLGVLVAVAAAVDAVSALGLAASSIGQHPENIVQVFEGD